MSTPGEAVAASAAGLGPAERELVYLAAISVFRLHLAVWTGFSAPVLLVLSLGRGE